jgi:hypothetical protein
MQRLRTGTRLHGAVFAAKAGLSGRAAVVGERLGCVLCIVGQAGRWPPGAVPGGWEAGMADDRELAGLDPFALLDGEAERLDAFFSGLGEPDWNRASRCAGWTVRDVLGHLTHGEDYHRACLARGTVAAFSRASPGAAVRTWTRRTRWASPATLPCPG